MWYPNGCLKRTTLSEHMKELVGEIVKDAELKGYASNLLYRNEHIDMGEQRALTVGSFVGHESPAARTEDAWGVGIAVDNHGNAERVQRLVPGEDQHRYVHIPSSSETFANVVSLAAVVGFPTQLIPRFVTIYAADFSECFC